MALAHTLGFPRIGAKRELKIALESFWRGDSEQHQLQTTGSQLRQRHWQQQIDAGLDFVTVGDFAWYDQVLNTLALLGAIPERFKFKPSELTLSDYFTLARGSDKLHAMEMTKWFDTNYHYLVPEWTSNTTFEGGVNWLYEELTEAQKLKHPTKVVLIGPLTLLYLGKIKANADQSKLKHALDLLPRVLAAYQNVLKRLQQLGVQWVQIDEPILSLDLASEWLNAFLPSYNLLSQNAPKLLLATYFGAVNDHADLLHSLPVDGIHLDLIRGQNQLAAFTQNWPTGRVLSAGIIDGRNIWRADLDNCLEQLQPLHHQLGAQLWIAPSCSLLHVPVDLNNESTTITLDAEVKSWLAFATQKLNELALLKSALGTDRAALNSDVQQQFSDARIALDKRKKSARIHNNIVQNRLKELRTSDAQRQSAFAERIAAQTEKWQLPLFPTTTIGSFPQTKQIRQSRAAFKRGEIDNLTYLNQMRDEIRHVVEQQEKLELDVLVHGEAERNDMVEYFGEQLWGYAFTEFGWVQSYGSRCVKPPIIYGDVYRPEAMTVSWSQYAQSLTSKPMKGMLTGPVTMLQWSFVRDDQPRSTTALQIALALRDEVQELEQAGIGMIQIDEPAFREGLPLKQKEWAAYLNWAVHAFRISSCGVTDQTQIHTHMCYSEFNDILPWIAAMDADVITIETSRSDMELLEGFGEFNYPNDIGPGVYDIHSPRIPTVLEMEKLLRKAREVIPDARLWVNPDCGLKTRNWPETIEALKNMVTAAQLLRAEVTKEKLQEQAQ